MKGQTMEKERDFLARLHKNRGEILRFCETHEHIFLYGAGTVGELMLAYLCEEGRDVDGFIVTRINNREYLNKPIYTLKEIEITENDGFILAVKESLQDELVELLKMNGVEEKNILRQRIFFPIYNEEISKEDVYDIEDETGSFFSDYEKLDLIGIRCNTDKNSGYHDYLKKYEYFIKKWEDDDFTLLELGVYHGESLKMWEEFFPQSHIIGVDIDEECMRYVSDHTEIRILDLSVLNSLKELATLSPRLIIDDASHIWSHQIKALVMLFPSLISGGIYILEDIGTSFGKFRDSFFADASCSAYDMLNALTCLVAGGEITQTVAGKIFPEELQGLAKEIDMISFIHGSAILIKK